MNVCVCVVVQGWNRRVLWVCMDVQVHAQCVCVCVSVC